MRRARGASAGARTSFAVKVAAGLGALALATAGCTHADDQPGSAATPGAQPSVVPTDAASASPSPSASASGVATGSASPASGSTATATPQIALLEWTKLPGDASNTIVSNGTWTLTVGSDGDWWSLGRGASGSAATAKQTKAPGGLKILDTKLSDDWAVVVYGDEDGKRPERAVVTALTTGKVTTLDQHSDLPPSSDGSWALDGSRLWHATDRGKDYCLASTDLTSGTSSLSWCAPLHQGFTNVLAAGGKTSMMTFDDKQPTSCRTIVSVSGTQTTPYADATACKGIQGAELGDGRIWSIVPNEHRYQQVRLFAATSSGVSDLGLGVNDTLTLCGFAAYWARDAAGSSPAAIMRWDGSQLSIAYESKGFLGQPLCAGHVLNIAEQTDSGDQELSAPVS